MAKFTSSYLSGDGQWRWLQGNHHGHSTVSDGKDEPAALVEVYERAGYNYLALSEHDVLLDPTELQVQTSMCLVPAVEVTSSYGQTLLHLGAERALPARQWHPRQIMEAAHEAGESRLSMEEFAALPGVSAKEPLEAIFMYELNVWDGVALRRGPSLFG